MSHFTVLVIHDENTDIEKLLAPYEESLKVAPYQVFTRQEAIDFVRKKYSNFRKSTDEECWKYLAEQYKADKDGNLFDDSNPNAKWDYWDTEKEWLNILKLKSGEMVNSAKLKDIDFSLDEKDYKKALRFWDIVVEHEPLRPDEKMPFSLYNVDYYHERYGSRENYAQSCATFYTYAVITPNGIWHEPGKMGWFATDNGSPESHYKWKRDFYKNFIEGENEELIFTIVDCHV